MGKPGQNSSHTPVEPSTRIGASLPSQWLKSPIRLTPLAFGAHTANDTPSTITVGGLEAARMRTDDVPQPFVATLGEQMQVELAEGGQEPVGVGDGVRATAACRSSPEGGSR